MRLSLRAYRVFLKLYPARFREEYGSPLERQFKDEYLEAGSASSVARLWLRTLADVARSLPVQIAREVSQDVRHTLRLWRRRPLHTAFAMAVLTIAIGANTGVFSVLNALLLRSLPFHQPERLAAMRMFLPGGLGSPKAFHDWRRTSNYAADAFNYTSTEVNLEGVSQAARIRLTETSWNFFDVIGTQPWLGRGFTAGEDKPGTDAVAVIGYGLWRQLYGGEHRTIGTTIRVNGTPLTIVGIAPPGFDYPQGTAVWSSTVFDYQKIPKTTVAFWFAVARLKDGLSWSQARQAFEAEAYAESPERLSADPRNRPALVPLREELAGPVRQASFVLMAGAGLLLLLACANLAGLTATRALQRESELSLRAALGASRGRLVGQLVVESVVLGGAGGVAGLAIAAVALPQLLHLLPSDLPSPTAVVLDRTVALGTLGIALLAGLGIGLTAAFRASRSDPARKIQGSTAATVGRERLLLQRSLVAAQVAISLVILAGAGLLLRSFREVVGVDPGFRTDGLAIATVALPSSRYETPAVIAWYAGLPERLSAIPGVVSASAVSSLPITLGDGRGNLTIEGRPFKLGEAPGMSYRRALPNYFSTVGIPLIQGREFDSRDNGGEMVVIINQALAKRFWPDGDAIGKRIKVGPPEREPWLTIVGVVGDVHNEALEMAVGFDTYEPHAQRPRGTMSVVVRTSGSPEATAPLVRAALRQNDAGIPVWGVGTMAQRVTTSLAPRRFTAGVLTAFGAAALLLASIGIYGVAAYMVGRRRREFAIRLALGAKGSQVRRQVVNESLRVVLLGILIGLPAGLALTSLIRGLLFNVKPGDPVSHLLAAVVLGALAVAATWLPARRATNADPVSSLRE